MFKHLLGIFWEAFKTVSAIAIMCCFVIAVCAIAVGGVEYLIG